MAHVIQLALGAFMSSLSVKGHTKSWEAHERDQQFGQNESRDIGKSQIHTGKNDLTRHVTHREAVFGTVIHSIFDAWHYEVLWTYALTTLL